MLGHNVRRHLGAAHTEFMGLDGPDRRIGRKNEFHRLVQVGIEMDVAGIAVSGSLEFAQMGQRWT